MDRHNQSVKVGDEVSYRSMEGCTVAEVVEKGNGVLGLSNGKTVPRDVVLEVFPEP